MRLFIAVNFSNEMKDRLETVIATLKPHAERGNFTGRANLHLTLVFLGEIADDRPIRQVMDSVQAEPFSLNFHEFGRFRRDGGDILWLGASRSDALLSVYRQLTAALAKTGFVPEKREYTPHLTLGREVVLRGVPDGRIGSLFPEIRKEGLKADVGRISLMKSERIAGKLTYTEIYARELTGEE